MPIHTPTSRFEATDTAVKDLNIGDTVRVVVTGKVTELEASRENEFDDDPPRFPGHVTIEDTSVSMKKVDGKQTDGLARMFDEEE